jgi:hypothetical protein
MQGVPLIREYGGSLLDKSFFENVGIRTFLRKRTNRTVVLLLEHIL